MTPEQRRAEDEACVALLDKCANATRRVESKDDYLTVCCCCVVDFVIRHAFDAVAILLMRHRC